MTARTVPQFRSTSPDGEDWETYFRRMHNEGKINNAHRPETEPDPDDSDDDLPEPVVITTPAHEVLDESELRQIPRGLKTWRNRLIANDWETKVGHCVAWCETSYYGNGNVRAEEHEEEQWWINAVKDGKYLTISYNLRNGETYGANTVRKLSGVGRNIGDKELKEMVETND